MVGMERYWVWHRGREAVFHLRSIIEAHAVQGPRAPRFLPAGLFRARRWERPRVFASYGYQNWTSPLGGYKLGVQFERLTDLDNDSLLYLQRGVTVGIFREVGR